MNIGLIGCGNIGKFLLHSLNVDRVLPDCRITSVYDERQKMNPSHLEDPVYGVQYYSDFEQYIHSGIDLVIEAANIQVVQEVAADIVKHRKDLIIVSVGALADAEFYEQLKNLSHTYQTKILLPSGAIGGLDVVRAAMSAGKLDSVSITTRKPPKALSQDGLTGEAIIFKGSASEAILLFPQNINVAVILSLAGLGCDNTSVTIIADPSVERNKHCIEAKGSFGKLTVQLENDPMPGNPKTSFLAALSVLSTLKNQHETIQIG
ncbi:aspartate dehydrogenase [Paenibacillus thalictri]|uniref:L-aspartate dehydrogenase n=1 Tax=Paenibacillus thalictri TaxID=2527873 RepID=A0A4Q9DLK1_9BACL|nr:aspartate dehydrogenase [Paenibacillus thalictri]TBL73298.1 aspartate dehydrogenase [Paenibacillus thalictri]